MAPPFVNRFRGHTMLGLLALLAALIAYVGAGVWLMESAEWTDHCRPGGRNLSYMVSALSCSPYLLDRGWTGIGLFAWLWSMPAAIAVMVVIRFREGGRAR